MSDFNTKGPEGNKFDPAKRVRYSTGQVLGADDFMQEQVFFLERDNLHQRGLHGYGVVCGLDVSIENSTVTVSPGLAVDHLGRSIRVDADQSGNLDEWLKENDYDQSKGVFVTLCYAECESDSLPIPGAPCRGDEEGVAASRITSGFEINFSASAQQEYEDAVRLFGEMLGEIHGKNEANEIDIVKTVEEFKKRFDEQRSQKIGPPSTTAPGSSKPLQRRRIRVRPKTSASEVPPKNQDELPVPWSQLDELMTGLLDLWVRELKPDLALAAKNCGREIDGDGKGCILLATLTEEQGTWSPNFDARPLLLSTRMLQEYQRRRDTQQLDHGRLEGLEDDDHQQYLPRSGKRPMLDNLTFEQKQGNPAYQVQGLRESIANGEALVHGQSAGGDLDQNYPKPQVSGILGHEIKPPSQSIPGSLLVLTKSDNRYHWVVRTLEPEDVPAPNLKLDELLDCNTASAATGDLLQHKNGTWVPDRLALNDLKDCAVEDEPNLGYYLGYEEVDGEKKWRPIKPPSEGGGVIVPPCSKSSRGDLLTCTGKSWEARPLRMVELADIRLMANHGEDLDFEFWLHPSIPDNWVEVKDLGPDMFEVLFETNERNQNYLISVRKKVVDKLARNVFLVRVYPSQEYKNVEWNYCRVRFDTRELKVIRDRDENLTLQEYARLAGLNYEGQSPGRDIITQFVRVASARGHD